MPSILVQAAHNAPETGTGAPGEAAWALLLAHAEIDLLTARGINCTLVGGWYQHTAPGSVAQDYDLFVSLHYDAAIYTPDTGCFADRATADPQGAASDRAIRLWEAIYPQDTGIPLHNERRNANTSQYYAFADTSTKTPGVVIEHGVGQGLDHDALFTHLDTVAEADCRAWCAFLSVTYDAAPAPTPAPPPEDPLAAAIRLANLQKREFEAYIRDEHHRADVDQAAAAEGNDPADLMLRWAQDHFNAGESVE